MSNTAMNPEDYYTAEEAAARLGLKLQTVRNYMQTGKIPKTKFKSLSLVSRADLEEYERVR